MFKTLISSHMKQFGGHLEPTAHSRSCLPTLPARNGSAASYSAWKRGIKLWDCNLEKAGAQILFQFFETGFA